MTISIHSGQLASPAQLAQLLRQGEQANLWRWVFSEREEGATLSWLADADQTPAYLATVAHARVFGADSELAWWSHAAGFALRLIGSGHSDLADVTWHIVANVETGANDHTLLNGTWDAQALQPQWREARIPHPQRYPVHVAADTQPERAVFVTQPLYAVDDKTLVVSRLRGVAVATQGVVIHDG